MLNADVDEYYTTRTDESERLMVPLKGRLERIRVRQILTRIMPAHPARIADIGGGPGVHAQWLHQCGFDVELLDPVLRHVDEASLAGLNARLGDARQLPWANNTFDVALLMGPLYHLTTFDDRQRALSEATRVLRPDGLVVVTAINRLSTLIGSTVANTLPDRREIVEEILLTGYSPSNDRQAEMYYHSVEELRVEMLAAGLKLVQLYGVTGPGGLLLVAIDRHMQDHNPATLQANNPLKVALASADMADAHPELLAMSSLLMAVGYRP